MTQPLIPSQLRSKQAEIEAQIASLNDHLAEATADLVHIAATIRLFDPTAADRPATVYRDATKAMQRSDFFALCKAALEALPEPLCTRQLALHVITAEGWDTDDTRLRIAIAHKLGERQRASMWLLLRRTSAILTRLIQCAPTAQVTNGGRFRPESCRLIW